ncbi:MAG TPA: hypothetical protein VFM39_08485 [bacterium]|nr:hypothetical protein [bacterium]
MPIGMYCVDNPDDFREIARGKFNLVHTYRHEGIDTATDNDARAYLDAARTLGLKVLMGIQ